METRSFSGSHFDFIAATTTRNIHPPCVRVVVAVPLNNSDSGAAIRDAQFSTARTAHHDFYRSISDTVDGFLSSRWVVLPVFVGVDFLFVIWFRLG